MSFIKRFLTIASLVIVLCSCTVFGHREPVDQKPQLDYRHLDSMMAAGQCKQAAELLKSSEKDFGKNDQLLYFMDTAMIHMLCGDYTTGNQYFQVAEDLGEKLWTKSVSRYSLSMVSNDLVIPYAGEDFERAQINLFSALSYMKLGQFDDAMVECQKLNTLLNSYNDAYNQDNNFKTYINACKLGNVYREDAFARYLSGIIREITNDLDGARIDYRAAFLAYQKYQADYGTYPPIQLRADILRVADALGERDVEEARALLSPPRKHK